ncbi:MAG: hypothetical protein R3Y68_00230 [Rikenellaceae bacterium]
MIKKVFLSIVALLTVICIESASAKSTTGWSGGAKVNIYTNWDSTAGVGVYARRSLNGGFRLEPSFIFLCNKDMSIDISADLHYPINLGSDIELYPLVGLSLNDPSRLGLGINFGGGVGYNVTNRINIDLGAKWGLQTQRYISNPFILSFGCGYKF